MESIVENDSKTIAKRLKFLRVMSGQTQETAARKLNISRSCLANYETKRRIPDTEMLAMFAKFYGVKVDYLTGKTTLGLSDFAGKEEELLELIPENDMLDLTHISPDGRVAILQFYSFLKEK